MIDTRDITVLSLSTMLRRILYICGVAVSVFLCFMYCQNPFSTREPEQPSGQQAAWNQPVAHEIVLDNLRSAISEKNVENYIRCFGLTDAVRENFLFVPELSVANNYLGVFTNWSIIEERNYINHLFSLLSPDSVSSLILTNVTEFSYGDSVRTTGEYDLLITHTNPSAPKQVLGRMELKLRKDAGALWYISSWIDLKTGDFPVWSMIKAEF